MSDDEVERFEITDYDLANEFNIHRGHRKQTKNQLIYGVWADDESGDEGPSNRPSFSKKSLGGGYKKPYTAPVSFVAGGVQQAGKPKVQPKDNEKDDDDEEKEEDQRAAFSRGSSSSSEEESTGTAFRGLSLDQMGGDIAGLRKKKLFFDNSLAKKGVGNWEKHTKGIGAKLLLQMGYQPGRGLGKDLQGIHAPIEAHLRKGRGAIGAYGPEKAQKIADQEQQLKEDGDKNKPSNKISQWRKDDGISKKAKVQYVYKSIEDVLEQSKKPGKRREFSELSKVKVIDMTGPEQRVLSGYHAISGVQRPSDQWEIRKEKKFANFELPELQHNLNLLVDLCEEAIVQNNKNLTYAEDRSVAVESEFENLKKVEEQEAKTIESLEQVLNFIEGLTEKSESNSLTLDMAAEAVKELQTKYYNEYCSYEIHNVAVAVVRPLLKDYLSSWQPLQNPKSPISVFEKWKSLLELETTFAYSASPQDPYQRLVWDAWMPCIRIAVNAWNCRKCEQMIDLLDAWNSMIPRWMLDNILQQLILPRIQHDVEEWNPLTDTIPIHTWILPWLPYLGQKQLESVIFPVIRHKLSVALVSWHPSDSSARPMLQPWASVFNKGEMEAFLVNNILPKLHLALQEFVVNPHQQHLDNWNWVMDWVDLLPTHIMASLLDKSFFPKWIQVLTLWLNLNPNYDQVTNWYQGWKSMMNEKLLKEPTIQEHFNTALSIMSRSIGGTAVPSTAASGSTSAAESSQRYQSVAECTRTSGQIPHGFKELVEKRCEERGIVWVPIPNRFREAKQVYRCGSVQTYIDRNVIFACDNNGVWGPISLQELLDKAVR